MELMAKYIPLEDLEVYKISKQLGSNGWEIYSTFDWKIKKIIGDQFITAIDSIAANIAEGYGRFHYLDKVRFYYHSRGSLFEARYWYELLVSRKIVTQERKDMLQLFSGLTYGINGLINSTMKVKNGEKTLATA